MSHTDHTRSSRAATHQCPRHDCKARVSRVQLACPRHWRLVDRTTQRRVYAAWKSGDRAAHAAAIRDAVNEINDPKAKVST